MADNGDGPAITVSNERPPTAPEDDVLARLERIAHPETGIVTGVRRVPVPPGEPAVESFVVKREDFTPFTDGQAVAHEEGGCGFTERDALVASYGEAIERYCGAVFRWDDFRTAAYDGIDGPALDPTAVVNFSAEQRTSMDDDALCGPGDELAWADGEDLATGAETAIPAQLVYLSYPPTAEPFVRNPITTGLAAGETRAMATRNGLAEVIERDAFVVYYLTETELPRLDIGTAPPRIRRLAERVTAHGLELTLLDATTDLGVPVAIAVLIDRDSRPAVTVAASAGLDATAVIESALEEVVQTRLAGIRQLERTARDPADVAVEEIETYAERGLFWAAHERIDDLGFWVESDRETTFGAFDTADSSTRTLVERVTDAGYDCYAVDVTTRDIAALRFHVRRVVAPRLHPLYLLERLRYLGGERLATVPVEMGYRETPPTEAELNTVPHPFP